MKAVEMYISTKVADGQSEVKDAVSLIESPKKPTTVTIEEIASKAGSPTKEDIPFTAATQAAEDVITKTALENHEYNTGETMRTSDIAMSTGQQTISTTVENPRKRLLSETASDQEVESTTDSATNAIDFSRFKRIRTDNQRKRCYSSCYSSDNNSDNTSTNAITLRRFKYFNNLSSAHHELHMNNLPPTVRKLIEKKSKYLNKTAERRKSSSESENELPVQPPAVSSGNISSHENEAAPVKTVESETPENSSKLLSSSTLLAAVTTIPSDCITLFNIQAPGVSKSATTITNNENRSGIFTTGKSSTTIVNSSDGSGIFTTSSLYSNVNVSAAGKKLENENPPSTLNSPISKDRSSTPTFTTQGVKTSLMSSVTTLPTLDISNITNNVTANNTNDKNKTQQTTLSTTKTTATTPHSTTATTPHSVTVATPQSEDFASTISILSNVNIDLFQRHLQMTKEHRNSAAAKNKTNNRNLQQKKDEQKRSDNNKPTGLDAASNVALVTATNNVAENVALPSASRNPMENSFETNNTNATEGGPHVLEDTNPPQLDGKLRKKNSDTMCLDSDAQRSSNNDREKIKSKRKRKDYEGWNVFLLRLFLWNVWIILNAVF